MRPNSAQMRGCNYQARRQADAFADDICRQITGRLQQQRQATLGMQLQGLTVRYNDHQKINLSFLLTSRCPCDGEQRKALEVHICSSCRRQLCGRTDHCSSRSCTHLFKALEPPVAALVCHLVPVPQPHQ